MVARQQYSPMGQPGSPSVSRSPHVRTPTPSASPAASPAPHVDHGGGHGHHMAPAGHGGGNSYDVVPVASDHGGGNRKQIAPVLFDHGGGNTHDVAPTQPDHGGGISHAAPFPPGYRYRKPGLFGGAPPPQWPQNDNRRHIPILKRRRFAGKTPASDERGDDDVHTYAQFTHELDFDNDDTPRQDDDVVLVEPRTSLPGRVALSPQERIATEEDFEELIDGGAVDDSELDTPPQPIQPAPRTETATKTVAVISLSTGKPPAAALQQYKLMGPTRLPVLGTHVHSSSKLLDDVTQATVASVSIANQTISVPVLKNLSVPIGAAGIRPQQKKPGQQIGPVIGVIASSVGKVAMSPVITLATSSPQTRVPVSLISQHQLKQKIVKTIEKPMALSLGSSKLSSLSVTHDVTLPAKIFQDDAASPDSTVVSEAGSSRDLDIEREISRHTELPSHALAFSERAPLPLGRADIKSPDPVPETIPDNIMEGDDDDKPDDTATEMLLAYTAAHAPQPPPAPAPPSAPAPLDPPQETVVKTIKAIANQNKDMSYTNNVIDSNMQITSEMAHESVQISIPSPTPSQERYLNAITMREHSDAPDDRKHVETFEDMLCMLENIDEPKMYGKAQRPQAQAIQQNPNAGPSRKLHDNPEPPTFAKREPDRLALQAASVPQLSPLSQPAELQSNMANVSQQLRNIMSSINQNAAKADATNMIRKSTDATTPTQVNFENLLPSSKVEVAAARPSPIQRIDKPVTQVPEPMPMSVAQAIGSRVNTLSAMNQMRKSPIVSPINSPVMQNPLMKSPAQSPLITNQSYNPMEDMGPTSSASQIIQMPALSRIQCSTTPQSTIHTNNTITTSTMNSFQNKQPLQTSILSHTLLQPTRQMNTNLPFNQQSISSSQPPALVMTSRPMMGNKEVPPNVTVRTHTIVSPGMSQIQKQPAAPLNFINTSKLLHTQLTSPLKRSKSTDEPKSEVIVGHIQPTKRHSVEAVVVKSEPMETDDPNAAIATTDASGNKIPQNNANLRNDESQNVLLKQLLQTSTTTATVVPQPQRTMTITRTAPALGTIPSLEAQLARPSVPPPTLAISQDVDISKATPRYVSTVSSSFVNRPMQTCIPTSSISPLIHTSHTTQSLMDVRKPPMKIMTKEETTPMPESSPTIKSMHMGPMGYMNMNIESQHQLQQAIKKEIAPPQQSPVHRPFTPLDVKKELIDESSQQSAASGVSGASDQGMSRLDHPMKEEYPESVLMDSTLEQNVTETPSEAKKRKRREYQQKKRKQLQMNMKAAAENSLNAANAKKRPRKGSRYEEDYDTFIDNLMAQLRLLPTMQIQEPALTTNFAVCPLFGSGDLTKLKNKDYDFLKGDLTGEFGNAKIPNVADYYNTKPFGDEEPLPEKPPASTQRGFYDQEFQPIMFDDDPEDKKLDFICKERDTDTPDSIVSCSSPECLDIEPFNRFPGLKLIDDDEEDEDSDTNSGRVSPIIPIIAPVPIRIKALGLYLLKEEEENQKALKTLDTDLNKIKMEDSPGSESNENVTVTLTLTSGAAEDILGVLKELAGILHIPPPTSYQIIERTATPPSHKLGLYRSKGKDGKEGTPIDIQSILNGAAKFCRHCDVVILDSVVRAKASEFPLLSANKGNAGEILCDSDSELYFCSTQCYERFAWRPTNIILDGKSKPAIKGDIKSDTETNVSRDREDFDTASNESMETDDLDIKPDIKDEKMDLSFMDSLDNDELMKEVGDCDVSALESEDLKSEQDEKSNQGTEKEKYRGIRYKAWSPGCIGPPVKYKRPTDRELTELVFRTGVAIMPVTNEDHRRCELCGIEGDGVADGVSRLLNCDVNRWVHLNCALWSEGVYETVSGALMNVETALATGSNATCAVCRRLGATVRCFKVRCGSLYHLGCAVKDNCVFYKNKTAFCASHAPKVSLFFRVYSSVFATIGSPCYFTIQNIVTECGTFTAL